MEVIKNIIVLNIQVLWNMFVIKALFFQIITSIIKKLNIIRIIKAHLKGLHNEWDYIYFLMSSVWLIIPTLSVKENQRKTIFLALYITIKKGKESTFRHWGLICSVFI